MVQGTCLPDHLCCQSITRIQYVSPVPAGLVPGKGQPKGKGKGKKKAPKFGKGTQNATLAKGKAIPAPAPEMVEVPRYAPGGGAVGGG